MKEHVCSAVTAQSNLPQPESAIGYPHSKEFSWLQLTRMKIKTVQIRGLTPSRLHPGKGWEPGCSVGDQGNGLLDE